MINKLYRSLKYSTTVCKHKLYVAFGAFKVGGLSLSRVLFHDLSKFFPSEFGPYRDKFEPESHPAQDVEYLFQKAWELHYSRNRHHWQYWQQAKVEGEPTPIPETYVREMIADWIAASLAYQKDKPIKERLNILPWVTENLPKMSLHRDTRILILRILLELGYSYQDIPTDYVGNLKYSMGEFEKFRQGKATW